MQRSEIPFNISILDLTPAKLSTLKPVKSLGIFDGASNDSFDEDGLFSSSIFGKVGDRLRYKRFSYINIKVPVFHPAIFNALLDMKKLYGGIMDGTEYVIWDDTINDFVRSDPIAGKTGYHYFVKYWRKIKFESTRSTMREQNILMIGKYADIAMTSNIVVIPAGLRDVEMTNDGRVEQDEINDLYRRVVSISNTITDTTVKTAPEIIDRNRYNLQLSFNQIYTMLRDLIEGKKKLALSKWASRNIMNGTRNVITAMNTSPSYLGEKGSVQFNDTMVGLYQTLKSLMPIALYRLRTGVLSKVFSGPNAPAMLVDKKTLKSKQVQLKPHYFQRYMTDEGLEKVITAFSDESIRDKPMEVDGHYLALVYKGHDGTFKVIHDIDQVPSARNKDDVYPITFCELLYLAGYNQWNKYAMNSTRYPITGVGSIYPSWIFVKTTIKSEKRRELDDNWEPMGDDNVAYEYPTQAPYFNSMSPHSSHLARAGGDFDGDMMSGNAVYTDESIEEYKAFSSMKKAYVGVDGRFTYSTDVNTVALVAFNMTGD